MLVSRNVREPGFGPHLSVRAHVLHAHTHTHTGSFLRFVSKVFLVPIVGAQEWGAVGEVYLNPEPCISRPGFRLSRHICGLRSWGVGASHTLLRLAGVHPSSSPGHKQCHAVPLGSACPSLRASAHARRPRVLVSSRQIHQALGTHCQGKVMSPAEWDTFLPSRSSTADGNSRCEDPGPSRAPGAGCPTYSSRQPREFQVPPFCS